MKILQNSLAHYPKKIELWLYSRWCLLTASKRVLPNFIIVGAQRSGTTSLYNYLCQHPQVMRGFRKEVKYFGCNYPQGINWYRSHFPYQRKMSPGDITGEASPYYLFHPLAAQRIFETLPDVRLIVLLRNPIDRAYSHYYLNIRRGREELSFEEAIKAEPKRLAGEEERIKADEYHPMYTHKTFSYLSRGIYARQLKRWFRFFSREQILVIKSEDLYGNFQSTYKKVMGFLTLPNRQLHNRKTFNAGNYDPINISTREKLESFYEPHNAQLYELLGTDFGW